MKAGFRPHAACYLIRMAPLAAVCAAAGWLGLLLHITRGPFAGAELSVPALLWDGFLGVTLLLALALAAATYQRRQAEKRLRETDRHYRVLVENLEQIVFLKDHQGRYLAVNQPF